MIELVDKDAFLKQERKWYCEDCDMRKGVKNGRKCFVYEIGEAPCRACDVDDVLDDLEDFPPASPWHRIDEPPKENGAYVVWWNYKGPSYWFRGVYFDGRWLFEHGTPKPDYWMPIEPPKE